MAKKAVKPTHYLAQVDVRATTQGGSSLEIESLQMHSLRMLLGSG